MVALAKQYKTSSKKEDLDKLEALLKTIGHNAKNSRKNSNTTEDKEKFIDMLVKLTNDDSPVNSSPTQILNRYLKN